MRNNFLEFSRLFVMTKIFYFLLSSLFLLECVSRPAPQVIYSAVIENSLSVPAYCKITWLLPSENKINKKLLKIRKNSEFLVSERIINMGTWDASAIIDSITCGGSKLVAPFPGVDSPKKKWRFRVEPTGLVSVGSS